MPRATSVTRPIISRLPPRARRRLGAIKRAALDPLDAPESTVATPPPARRPVATAEPVVGETRIELRRRNILAGTPGGGLILEIGPAHNGTLPRRDGFDTRNLDYLDRKGLVDKYADFEQYDPDDIEKVDYVLEAGTPFSDVIDERFDLVLASHVLEHTTSLVDFINQCAAVLKPEGHIALVVPDQRFCFDRFRQRSSIGRVIDAHLDPPSVHTVGTLADFTLNAVRHRGTGSWKPGHQGRYSLIHDLRQVRNNMERAAGPTYIDVHNWVFTPHHLRLLLQDLADLDLIHVRETHFHPTVGHEFFLNLSPTGTGSGLSRTKLLRRADAELRTLDLPDFSAGNAVPS